VRIVTSQKSTLGGAGVVGCEGKLWRYRPTVDGHFSVSGDLREMTMPAGVSGVRRRPSWRNYNIGQRSRLVGTGAWTSNVLIDELMRAMRQGIPAPFTIPTVVAGAGPGPSGAAICVLRFLDSRGGRVSPKSAPAPSVTLTNQGRVWSTLPTTCVDSSVDSLQGMVSMDGANYRVAWTRQLGVTTVTENVATLALGAADPGEFDAMPLGSMNEIYHDAQWIAGNDRYPQRIFKSAIGELERYEGLFVDTDGEWVNGLFTQNDLLFAGSFHKIYRIAGYTENDVTREVEKRYGLIGHDGIVNLEKRTIVPTTIGFQLYDGQWHYLMDDRRSEFIREYKTFRSYYERAQGFYHPLRKVYMFGPVPHTGIAGNCHWILDVKRLTPEIESDEFTIAWADDAKNHEDTTRASFYLPGSSEPQVAVGTTYGILLDDYVEDADDDLDGYLRQMVITPATIMPDPGGGELDGNTFHRIWLYFQCSSNSYQLRFFSGGESCAFNPQASLEFIISAIEDLNVDQPVEERAHLLENCAGSAFSFTITVPFDSTPPARGATSFRGYGLTHAPGIKARQQTGNGPPG
jgi:hypothetical protein